MTHCIFCARPATHGVTCAGCRANDYVAFTPSEAEIRAACEALQATWTEAEHERHRVGKRRAVEVEPMAFIPR